MTKTGPGLPQLTVEETIRYGRHLVLPEIGAAGQRKLKASSVLVVGVGGLGTPAATYLAAAGVGRIGLVDEDTVEVSNLHRQFLFSEAEVGKSKALVAKSRLLRINPNIKVDATRARLTSANARRIISQYDLVVDATDNLPSRYLINDACVLLDKPDVYASALGLDGQASVFDATKGPCYRCLFPNPPPPESVQSCSQAGVMGAVTGILGGVQAMESINLVVGRGSSLIGRLLLFNGHDSSFEELRVRKDTHCPVCGTHPTIRRLIDYEDFCGVGRSVSTQLVEIGPRKLNEMLGRSPKPLLIDVREPYEHELVSIKDSKLIPLGQVRKRANELEKSRQIVVYCHHGIRSAIAVRILREEGFGAINLKGGIEAWRRDVEPDMLSY